MFLLYDVFKIRVVCTLVQTYQAGGNQSLHSAAQECLHNRTMVPTSTQEQPDPQQACELHRQQKYRQIKNFSRQRFAEASPPGFLDPLQFIPRTGKIFANKLYVGSACAPDFISKGTTPGTPPVLGAPTVTVTARPTCSISFWYVQTSRPASTGSSLRK